MLKQNSLAQNKFEALCFIIDFRQANAEYFM